MAQEASVFVRVGDVTDVAALAHLRFVWRSGERGERGLDGAAFESALLSWMREHHLSHVPFLAFRGSAPIGMVWLAVVERIPGPEHFRRTSGYVQSAYVISQERSKGVGTALLTLLLEHASERGLEYIATHPSKESFAFYRRLGFEESGRVLERRL